MRELKVQPIRNGTVIDHIAPGRAMAVLRVLGLPRPGSTSTLAVAMFVPTQRGGDDRKDILKIEDRELDPAEVSKVALVSPHATINIVREFEVAKKMDVDLPDKVRGIVRCPNRNCITNHEPIETAFAVDGEDPLVLRCHFCDTRVHDVSDHVRA